MNGHYIYIDCASGVAGDMLLGSLIDAGADIDYLNDTLHQIFPDKAVTLSTDRVTKSGITALQLVIEDKAERKLRHWSDIQTLINESKVSHSIKQKSLAVILRIAQVEARIHNIPIEQVHFHEIGAIDTIVDVVGVVAALENLGVSRLDCSAINVGGGTVKIDHGRVPVPAPATLALARNIPIYGELDAGELATPTGMALLAELVSEFGALKNMKPQKIGYGAGQKDRIDPNVVRVTLGDWGVGDDLSYSDGFETDKVFEIEANIDDQSPELLATIPSVLLEAGALDVSMFTAQAKKGRVAMTICVLVEPSEIACVLDSLFRETTTFGVRYALKDRLKLRRAFVDVNTCFGSVSIKLGAKDGRIVTAAPEFDVCHRLAKERGVGVRLVMDEAKVKAHQYVGKILDEVIE